MKQSLMNYKLHTIKNLNGVFLNKLMKLSIFYNRKTSQTMPEQVHHQINATRKTFQTLYRISKLLNTNLDPATLSYCIRLCENGVNPQALATVVKELQREVKALNNAQTYSSSKIGANK